MPERDASQEALRQVERITGSKPVRGETLVGSRKLNRLLSEAKKRASSDLHTAANDSHESAFTRATYVPANSK